MAKLQAHAVKQIIEIADPIGVVAAATPVTNPISTVIFKSLICLKTRNPIIFGFRSSAQECGDLEKEVGLDMNFKSLGIDEKEWNKHLDRIAMLAYEDQCSPANPRVPLMEDMKEILKASYKGFTLK